MSFSDSFNRADENLEASANWTGGSTAAAAVRSNMLAELAAGFYQCPDQGSADHYSQCTNQVSSGSAGGFICVRLTDDNNYIGMRQQAASYQVFKMAAGSFSLLGSFSTTPSAGDVMYLEASGNNITFKLNGTTQIGPVSDSFNNTETRQGVAPRVLTNPLADDFLAASLAAAGGGHGLFIPSVLNGLGSGGPFFNNQIG